MNQAKKLNERRKRRASRTRSVIKGTPQMPRLSVFRSSHYTYAQLIDDEARKTLVSVSTKATEKDKATKIEKAKKAGESIAEKAKKIGIEKVVFDRGSYKYHGRVKALAEGARSGGLVF
ncbi:MAG: 50S ribosomal protein L18 [Candidatus Harrisonbacteria bacterium CG10_big_fil_rev_8_21_14_0_10_40_38]|uniref:Large ribosomal subunit protein uL18 n=1 Tax=Candidatus Harrisonbacteria bacterium CG10_big_fil_rev_8_21_14_0_10_40_38 TaxID=1974583 RepID=A0A2H0USI7_9BACT|nr:MAG: 50S ribosomal protein L18 [Candidatus Harrisonbacteria bacterium CG10_big_fil_rev_8_21_14_0_10_40_38]